jgi:chromosome segregation ATPase
MERLVQDYESRLLEANVTKTLLSRKERQVESLTSAIELERKKATAALDRERIWREEMEKARHDSKLQVEEATAQAMLMEGRYNSISSHWKDQGEEVKRATTKLRGEISELVDERRKDDEKIIPLQELCDQQDSSIKELIRQNEEISRQFEAYKQEQENWLRDVKLNAHSREQEQERLLEETRQTLAKLKWALNVKENVRGAQ